MKYLIVGTGGTGSSVGGFLALKGLDVTFISRGNALEALKKNGLILKSTLKGDHIIKNSQFLSQEEYKSKADVIFVCVKSYSVEEIIPIIKKAAHNSSIVIPIMNGYNMSSFLSKHLDIGSVLEGCMYISAFVESPGVVVQLGQLFKVVFGAKKNQNVDKSILEQITSDLKSSGIETILSDCIERDTFKKFTFISAYASCGAYYDIDAGVMQTGHYRQTFINLCQEIQTLGQKLGIEFDVDTTENNLKILQSLTPDTTASLQKDMKAGKPTEIDGVLFSVVQLGKKLDVLMPTYEKIATYFKKY